MQLNLHLEMKNSFFKTIILGFFLLSDLVLFAQPGDDDGSGGLEGGDTPPAPIDGKLIWLGIIAILFAFYTLKRKRQQVY